MIAYDELLRLLREASDRDYKLFHQKLLKNEQIEVIGVRTPTLRKLAKRLQGEIETLISFPDDYYEVTFCKCAAASLLPFEEFGKVVDRIVPLLNNWAVCDCFAPTCVKRHREEFLPYIEKYFSDGREFVRRFSLTTLLHFYVDEEYLPLIAEYLKRCPGEPYYVMMAAAWLLSEVLVKDYAFGKGILAEGGLAKTVQRRGIQKARESNRLSEEQKRELSDIGR